MQAVCPLCDKDDVVQKVSAIVSIGRSSGTFSGPSGGVAIIDGKVAAVGGYTNLSGSTLNDLARLLTPPTEPKEPSGFSIIIWILSILILFGFSLNFSLYVVYGYFKNFEIPGIVAIILIIFLTLGILIGGILILIYQDTRIRKKHGPQYMAAHEAWELAMKFWNRLYYCHRDDIVFDPDTGKTCKPKDLYQLLYQPHNMVRVES